MLTEWAALGRQSTDGNGDIDTLAIGSRLDLNSAANRSSGLFRQGGEVLCAYRIALDNRSGLSIGSRGRSEERNDGMGAHLESSWWN